MRCRYVGAGLAAAASVALLTGCGTSARTDITPEGAALLQRDVLTVTRSAAAHDGAGVRAGLATLRRNLAAARASGDVSAARQQRIEAIIARVAAHAAVLAPAPTPSATATTSTAEPTRTESSNDGGDDGGNDGGNGKGKGKGNGKGKGKG